MSRATQTALIQDDRTVYEAAAGTAVGLSGVTFAVGLAALLAFGDRRPVAGLELSVVFGALLLALGTSVAGFGAASRFGYVDAAPQPSAGIVAAAAFTGIWFIVGAIVRGSWARNGRPARSRDSPGDRVRDDRAPSRRYRIDGARRPSPASVGSRSSPASSAPDGSRCSSGTMRRCSATPSFLWSCCSPRW